jgi:hypothetical protein
MHDAMRAVELLAKAAGKLKDVHEVRAKTLEDLHDLAGIVAVRFSPILHVESERVDKDGGAARAPDGGCNDRVSNPAIRASTGNTGAAELAT